MYVQIQVIKLLFLKNSISLKKFDTLFSNFVLIIFCDSMFWSFKSPYYTEPLKEVIIHITVNAAWYPDAQAPSLPKPEIPAEQEQGNPTSFLLH